MCIHTLRYYHDGCTHHSVVPTSGPGFVPPEKCATVQNALHFYHTQPLRPPEMYPPPCPRPCAPVWGNEACKGNVRCAFRPGKCDDCIREDQLMDLARYLVNGLKIGENDGSVARERTGVLMLWNLKNRKETKRKMAELKAVAELIEEDPGSFDDEGLKAVVAKMLVEKAEMRASENIAPFWRLFRGAFADQLSGEEFASLDKFLDGPPLDLEALESRTPSVASNARTSSMSLSHQLAALDLNEEPADFGPGTFAQTMSLPASPMDSEFKSTLSEPDIPTHSRWPPPPQPTPTTQPYQQSRTATSTPAFGSNRTAPKRGPYVPPHKRPEQSRPGSAVLMTPSSSFASHYPLANPGWSTGMMVGSCVLPHHVGHVPPQSVKAQTQSVLDALDEGMVGRAEKSALQAARVVYTGLAEGDAREDLCGAGWGNYVDGNLRLE